MPSVYVGCRIEDDIAEALKDVRGTFQEYQQQTDAVLAQLAADLAQLRGPELYAEATIGVDATDQVRWVAKAPGQLGNDIRIMYRNLGPIVLAGPTFDYRPPSAEVVGDVIYINLAILGGNPLSDPVGAVDPAATVAVCLPVWLSNPDVADLVAAELVGAGSGIPSVTSMVPLTGGEDAPLKDAEDLASDVAKQFGHSSYQDFMRSLSIPVVESDAEAQAYLESVDDSYVIINKKLFLVEGTNLVGLRNLYRAAQKDMTLFKRLLSEFAENDQTPHVMYTETLGEEGVDVVCNEEVSLTTFKEYYVTSEVSMPVATQMSRTKSLPSINPFIFWMGSVVASAHAYAKLSTWGFVDDYITSILSGESPIQSAFTQAKPPVVSTIEIPTLFDQLHFTDAEIVELLEKDVSGIKPPSSSDQDDRQKQVDDLMRTNRRFLDNGLTSKVKKPVVALQAINLSSTMNDDNLSRELATRGKACARTSDKFKIGDVNIPNLSGLDLPNLPTDALPDAAKKVESAFAALSSVISSASKLFDAQVDGLLKTCKSVLNSVQNLLSLTDNLFNNSLVKCLLGTSSGATGLPDAPSPSNPGGSIDVPVGGLPLPMSLFKDVLKKLSVSLDKTLTTSFESLMRLISAPLCMVTSLLSSIMGIDLGGLTNPCSDGKNPDGDCNKNEVQEIINNSTDMRQVFDALPQMDSFNTERATTAVTESVQKFTGDTVKTAQTTVNDIQRGINDVIDDVMKGLASKTKTMNELFKAVKDLVSDSSELSDNAEEAEKESKGCGPPSLGFFTDAVTGYI